MSLVSTLREITASEDDNYFKDGTLVYYINQGQKAVCSLLVQREKAGEGSFRVLDKLRATDTNILTGFTQDGSHYVGTQATPSSFLDWLFLDYEGTPLLELPVTKQYLLKWGNHEPSVDEGYFSIIGSNFKCFLHELPDGTTDELNVRYLKLPADITDTSTSFTDLPDNLINAVLYKAATMMGTQEGREDLKAFENKFQQELQSSLF